MRPALIVSPDEYNRNMDFVIAFITSKLDGQYRIGDYKIEKWEQAGCKVGQFLAIGIVTRFFVKKSEADQAKLEISDLQDIMKQKFYYPPEIYHNDSDEEYHYFYLKEEVFSSQLIGFLEKIYPKIYNDPDFTNNYDKLLVKLKESSSTMWMELAESKSQFAFQYDDNGMWDIFRVNGSKIRINYDIILLSMEGKILMEEYGRQFNFFKYTIMQAYKNFSLAGALRIYITG